MLSIDKLCYIFLLHQTTTPCQVAHTILLLCYIFLLHQTTTKVALSEGEVGCVISFFYIKPQPDGNGQFVFSVVLYLSSTSNHNLFNEKNLVVKVVLYLSSTSNHN